MFVRNLFSLFVFSALVYFQSLGVSVGFSSDEISGKTMGTTYSIKLGLANDPSNRAIDLSEIKDEVEARLQAINQEMSTYIPDSVISQFNQSKKLDSFPISSEFALVVGEAKRISELTGGRFDITVRPLVNFWGFGNVEKQRTTLPSGSEIEDVLSRIGFDKLRFDPDAPSLGKSIDHLEIDLSAIAKGYAVDQIASIIAKRTPNYLVEIGGEVFAAGVNPETDKPWTIAIEDPASAPYQSSRTALAKVGLADQGLATSGDYRNVVFIEGKSFQHTMDPTTGYPVDDGVKSVSVISENCMIADALATSLMVYPPAELKAFATKNQLSVLVVFMEDGNPVIWTSPKFSGEIISSEVSAEEAVDAKPAQRLTQILSAVVVFGLAIVGMAVGVIVSNRQLKGSCGGLSAMAGKSEEASPCSLCTKPVSDCPKKQESSETVE